MKTNILYIFFAIIIGFTSCADKDPNDVSGEWNMQELSLDISYTTQAFGNEAKTVETTGLARDINVVMNFDDKDGKFTTTGDYVVDVVQNDNGTISNSSYEMSNFLFDGIWSQNGDTVTVVSDSQNLIMVIDEISESNLAMSWDMVEEVTLLGTYVKTVTKGAAKYTR